MRIIFMGTPQFAVPALAKLIDSEHEIVAVYTMPPRPAGRGQLDIQSSIHALALQHGLNVLTPKNFKDDVDYQQFASLKADVAVVAAYGVILPERILNATKHGCINIHPSKLPRWRGAAPIQHTILAGDKETSVCIMKMDKGMDTGDIILERTLAVNESMTSQELHDITSKIGAEMVLEVLMQLETGTAKMRKQAELGETHARKIERADERLDFGKSSYLVNAQVRAFSPRPGAYFTFNGENIKIIEAESLTSLETNAPPGTVIDDDLTIACKGGALKPMLLQREGRKMIYLEAFLRGFKIPKGALLTFS